MDHMLCFFLTSFTIATSKNHEHSLYVCIDLDQIIIIHVDRQHCSGLSLEVGVTMGS